MTTKARITLILAVTALALVVSACPRTAPSPPGGNQARNQPGQPAQQVANEPEPPRRGCPDCHVKISEGKDYSLAGEAFERTRKSRGRDHPSTAPDGTRLDENTQVETCLSCHKPGPDQRAAAAPLTLRAIVHPSHMSSEIFLEKHNANCFTCHEVDNQGVFLLLTREFEVNDKGVPTEVPIKGAMPPSQTTSQ